MVRGLDTFREYFRGLNDLLKTEEFAPVNAKGVYSSKLIDILKVG